MDHIETFLFGLIAICSVLLILFIFKELIRNLSNGELKKIFEINQKENLERLFGTSKTTFLVLMATLITISISSLTFLSVNSQIKDVANVNNKTTQILQDMLDRIEE